MSAYIRDGILILILALIVYNVISYVSATGTVAEKLAAAWNGSLTIFMAAWAAVASFLVGGLNLVAQVTGDPEFGKIADQINGVIPPQYHWVVPTTGLVAAALARTRTLQKP